MRESSIWNCYSRYFPIKLIKTVNLDPTKNYLICVHPHGNTIKFESLIIFFLKYKNQKGLVPYGICTNFGTEATGFKQLFPGLTPHLLTLNMCFYVPIVREILLLLGCGVASAKSIKFILSNKGICKMMGQVGHFFWIYTSNIGENVLELLGLLRKYFGLSSLIFF